MAEYDRDPYNRTKRKCVICGGSLFRKNAEAHLLCELRKKESDEWAQKHFSMVGQNLILERNGNLRMIMRDGMLLVERLVGGKEEYEGGKWEKELECSIEAIASYHLPDKEKQLPCGHPFTCECVCCKFGN